MAFISSVEHFVNFIYFTAKLDEHIFEILSRLIISVGKVEKIRAIGTIKEVYRISRHH